MLGKKGFTLIELLVVMAIVAILTAMALVNTGKNDDRDVRVEAEKLVTFLRDVQNKTFTAEKISGASGKICGFGVHYNSGTPNDFQLFYAETQDISSSSEDALDVECESSDVSKKMEDGAGSLAKDYGNSFYFKSDIEAVGGSVGSADPPGDIFFLIPHGEVYYDGNPGPAEISIQKESGVGVTIDINETGNISYK